MSFSELSARRSRRIPPKLRQLVWETYMKNPKATTGPCIVCNSTIHILNFECGHVISHADGGSISVENLRPICGSCNKSMGAENLFEYKAVFFDNKNKKHNFVSNLIDKFKIFKIEDLPPVPSPRPRPIFQINEGCSHILIKGKRKGMSCGKKIKKKSYCISHVQD